MMEPATVPLTHRSPMHLPGTRRLPAHGFFVLSAVFHYLGPAFAVLLFAQLAPLGVAWLRIATAAAIFAVWRRPWRYVRCWR
jgi:inner membrane transporter RhtA